MSCAGPDSHTWQVTLDSGWAFIESGCPDCDASIEDEPHVDTQTPIPGRLTRQVHCTNALHTGPGLCPDCVERWQFTPEVTGDV